MAVKLYVVSVSSTVVPLDGGISDSAPAACGVVPPQSSIPNRASAGIESAVIMDSSVSATIAIIYGRVAVVIIAMIIIIVNTKVPSA